MTLALPGWLCGLFQRKRVVEMVPRVSPIEEFLQYVPEKKLRVLEERAAEGSIVWKDPQNCILGVTGFNSTRKVRLFPRNLAAEEEFFQSGYGYFGSDQVRCAKLLPLVRAELKRRSL